jgi:hypothetical protein
MYVPVSFPTIFFCFGKCGRLMVATVGAVATVQQGVAHFENKSPHRTFGNEITSSLVPCYQKIRLITKNQIAVRRYFEERKILLQIKIVAKPLILQKNA